jgi:hypothetical protein
MSDIAKTLKIAEKLLRSNRYLAEADMCKAAAAKAVKQERALKAWVQWADGRKWYGFQHLAAEAKKALK